MTIQIIPTFDDPSYLMTTTLEGTTYVMSMQFNQRCASWYLSLADVGGVDIANGIKVICGMPLLRRCKDPRRPAGEFVCMSSTSDSSPPGLEDLVAGTGRCTLYYLTSDVVALLTSPGGLDAFNAQVDANAGSSPLSTYGQQ